MANNNNSKAAQPRPLKSEEAKARSAAALRENLKRRKAKARGESTAAASPLGDGKTQ